MAGWRCRGALTGIGSASVGGGATSGQHASTASHDHADGSRRNSSTTTRTEWLLRRKAVSRHRRSFPARISTAGQLSRRLDPASTRAASRFPTWPTRAPSSTFAPQTPPTKRLVGQQATPWRSPADLSRRVGPTPAAPSVAGRQVVSWNTLRSSRLTLRSGRGEPSRQAADLALICGEFALGGDPPANSRSATAQCASFQARPRSALAERHRRGQTAPIAFAGSPPAG